MIFLVINFLLFSLILSLVFIVFILVQSLNLPLSFPILGDLIVILATLILSYFVIVIVLASINKFARILLGGKEGELIGFDVALWTIKETSWDMVQTITRKILVLSTFPIVISRLFGFKIRKGTGIVGYLMNPEVINKRSSSQGCVPRTFYK